MGAELSFRYVVAAFIIGRLNTIRTNIVFRNPPHRSLVVSDESVVGKPSSHGAITIGVSHLGAGVVVEVPPSIVCDHLVVVIIE